jgi:hypothetical protein
VRNDFSRTHRVASDSRARRRRSARQPGRGELDRAGVHHDSRQRCERADGRAAHAGSMAAERPLALEQHPPEPRTRHPARERAGTLRRLMVVHLKKGLPASPLDWGGTNGFTCPDPFTPERSELPESTVADTGRYGINATLQRALAFAHARRTSPRFASLPRRAIAPRHRTRVSRAQQPWWGGRSRPPPAAGPRRPPPSLDGQR